MAIPLPGQQLKRLLKQHHAAAMGWALRCTRGNQQLAEEALHDAYLKVLSGKAKFSQRSEFKTWLFAVIRNTAVEHSRKNRFYRLIGGFTKEEPPADSDLSPTISEMLDYQLRSQKLKQALNRLPARQYDVICLMLYSELSIQATSEVLGISVGSARTHYTRGKQRLEQLLTDQHADG